MENPESTVPARGKLLLWITLFLGAVSLGLASFALSLLRSTMESQTLLAQSVDSMDRSIKELKTAPPPKPVELKAPTLPRPSVRLAREPGNESADRLQSELDQVVASMQGQFPKLPEALHVIAMMKAQTRKYAEAQDLWQQCIRLAPKQELYYVNLASVAMEQGNNELALNTLRQAVALGFESFDIIHHLGIALSNLGLYEETIPTIEKSLKKFPNAASHWLLLGQAQLELEKTAEAEASFRKAMELGVSAPAVYVGLGNACTRQGKREEGAKYLKKFAELKAQDKLSGQERYQVLSDQEIKQTTTTIFTEAATVYFRQKDPLQAERLLLRCVALNPTSRSALRAVADLYFKTKMLPEERVVRERIIELGSDLFSDYIDLAKVCAQLDDRESSEGVLKLAMTMHPEAVEPLAALSQIYLESNKLDKARWYAQQSIERQPTPEGFRFLASICQRQQDPIGAAEALRLAKQLETKP